jgi:hypothetical protein
MLRTGLEEKHVRELEVLLYQALTENGVDLSPLLERVDIG